jgi:hypothetical protein
VIALELESCLLLPFAISNCGATIAYGVILGFTTKISGWAYMFRGASDLQEFTVHDHSNGDAAAEVNPTAGARAVPTKGLATR